MVCPQCGTLNENQHDQCVRCKKPLHPAGMKGKIPCAVHANREATTSCGACGTRLCDACAVSANGIAFCDGCAPANAVRVAHDEDYELVPVLDPARVEVASFDGRLLAGAIDFGIWLMASGVIAIAIFGLTGRLGFLSFETSPALATIFYGIPVVGGLVYNAVLTAMNGQTIGQQLTGVIVLAPDGHILPTNTAILRTAALALSILPLGLGFLWMLWDKDKLTWHDRIANTRVFDWTNPT